MTDSQFAAEVQNKSAQIALLAVQVELQGVLRSMSHMNPSRGGILMAIEIVKTNLFKLGLSRLEDPATGQPEGKDGHCGTACNCGAGLPGTLGHLPTCPAHPSHPYITNL
jgi:hypothetical protein